MKFEQVEPNSERWFDLTPLLNEEFRDIKGFEGKYQISNYGRVKSLKREIKFIGANLRCKYIRHQKIEEKILKCSFDKDGYVKIGLSLNGNVIHKRGHYLVAKAFIENPNNYPCINHKNEIKTDNIVRNLEWCTVAYNNAYGSRCKKVNQYDLDGNFIKTWNSSAEICRVCGFKKRGNITACCKKRKHCKTAYGYIWKYYEL
jgi:hypothetical protein